MALFKHFDFTTYANIFNSATLINIKCYNGLNLLSNSLFFTYSPLTVSPEV